MFICAPTRSYFRCVFATIFPVCRFDWKIISTEFVTQNYYFHNGTYIYILCMLIVGAGIDQSVYRPDTGWTVQVSNPGGGEIFRTHPNWPWDPPCLLYDGNRISFPGTKRPGRGVNHPPQSTAEVKKRVAVASLSAPFCQACQPQKRSKEREHRRARVEFLISPPPPVRCNCKYCTQEHIDQVQVNGARLFLICG
jgi:hypothetical protein